MECPLNKANDIFRDFATNIGMSYHTPEEFFLGHDAQPFTRDFDPSRYLDDDQAASTESSTFGN